MGWYIPFARLSQTQQSTVDAVVRGIGNRSQFISGFAGSGKSVVLANVLEKLRIQNPRASFAFVSYTHALVGMAKTALITGGLDPSLANGISFSTVHSFKSSRNEYDYVFVDEVQDLEHTWLQAIRNKSRHVVLAGDYEQSIYDDRAPHSFMQQLFNPESYELREVFRLTPSLKQVAISINPDANRIVAADPVNSVNADIREVLFDDLEDEAKWVIDEASRRALAARPSAILFSYHQEVKAFLGAVARLNGLRAPSGMPQNDLYTAYNELFAANNIPISFYGNSIGTLEHGEKGPHTYFMTIHSAKGLDFRNVFMPMLASTRSDMKPRVCFVGVTRSFENLFLSHTSDGPDSPFDDLPSNIVVKLTPSATTDVVDEDDIFF